MSPAGRKNNVSNYPIIEQRSLPKARRGGPWGVGFRSRPTSDLPLPNAHEAVVYKSGDTYVVDDGRSRPSEDRIVNATSISVVDMREEAPVRVHVPIPSADAAEFTVQATFLCTVKKPEEVVEAGLKDMADPLTQYLIRHQPLFHVGEEYEFDQINTVRRSVTAEIKAYVSVKPPRFRGMDVKLGNVQVVIPEELAEFHRKRREPELEGRLNSEEQRMEHDLAEQRQEVEEIRRRHAEEGEPQRRHHEQLMEEMRRDYEQRLAQQELTHDELLRSAKFEFEHAISETERLTDAIGADQSEIPTLLAASAGERNIAETAELLNQDRQRRRDEEAADKLRRETWRREDDLYERQVSRDDARLRYTLKVEELKAQLEVVKAGVARGLADHQTIDKLMDVISEAVKQLESASADIPDTTAASTTEEELIHQADNPEDERQGGDPIEAVQVAESVGEDPDKAGLAGSWDSGVSEHYLTADIPANSRVKVDFSLLVRITDAAPTLKHAGTARMKPFHVTNDGTEITIIVQHSDGLRALTPLEQVLIVPPRGDSEPTRFAFRAEQVGLFRLMITAFNGGTCLGELVTEVSVGAEAEKPQRIRTLSADLESLEADPGEVTLQVRFDGSRYSFQLLSDSYIFEPVIAEALTAEPGEAAERAIAVLNEMAAGRSEYRGKNARTWMQEAGIGLWADMVPQLIKEQFWQLRPHIGSFSIASGRDIIPWELLYPLSPSNDVGFLVEQFPVLRRAYGQGRCRHLSFRPALWIVPPMSPANAEQEVAAVRARISGPVGDEIDDLEMLIERINSGAAGLLHFACHNTFSAESGGSSIYMRGGSFVPALLNRAVTTRALFGRSPLVFINACRTAADAPQYTKLLGWASQFMAAGAGAFVGTLWAVPSDSARVFAERFYDSMTSGETLGSAMLEARMATARAVEDPTWLAYTLYGDPRATVNEGSASPFWSLDEGEPGYRSGNRSDNSY